MSAARDALDQSAGSDLLEDPLERMVFRAGALLADQELPIDPGHRRVYIPGGLPRGYDKWLRARKTPQAPAPERPGSRVRLLRTRTLPLEKWVETFEECECEECECEQPKPAKPAKLTAPAWPLFAYGSKPED